MSLNLPKLNGPIRTVETLSVGANVRLGRTGTEQLHFRKIREKEAFTILDNAGKYFRAKVTMLSGARVEISSDRPFDVYADGERSVPLPALFEVLPGSLKVAFPKDAPSR